MRLIVPSCRRQNGSGRPVKHRQLLGRLLNGRSWLGTGYSCRSAFGELAGGILPPAMGGQGSFPRIILTAHQVVNAATNPTASEGRTTYMKAEGLQPSSGMQSPIVWQSKGTRRRECEPAPLLCTPKCLGSLARPLCSVRSTFYRGYTFQNAVQRVRELQGS